MDDNKLNLSLLHTFVKKRGYGPDLVQTAEDGAQAIDSFQAQSARELAPDIVFMDLSMPVCDGYEATRAIRKHERACRASLNRTTSEGAAGELPEGKRAFIVALTGNTGAHDRDEAFESGCDMYMTKPMSMKDVGKLLDGWRE